jgi:ABC-type nickel/cobalt efflux system permease component RcnA
MAVRDNAEAQRYEWPAAVVAVAILLLLGSVLVAATMRWNVDDVKDMFGTLSPLLGIVTGAFVTYFFTRQAASNAVSAARSETETTKEHLDTTNKMLGRKQAEAETHLQRARELHNALSVALGMADPAKAEQMRRDPAVRAVLDS